MKLLTENTAKKYQTILNHTTPLGAKFQIALYTIDNDNYPAADIIFKNKYIVGSIYDPGFKHDVERLLQECETYIDTCVVVKSGVLLV